MLEAITAPKGSFAERQVWRALRQELGLEPPTVLPDATEVVAIADLRAAEARLIADARAALGSAGERAFRIDESGVKG